MNTDTIIEKIKKLLRMKRGGTPDEIATALRLAQELAEKHGIDMADVDENAEGPAKERPITHLDATTTSRLQKEFIYAALICQNFFNISALIHRKDWRIRALTFIGTEWDLQIALYVYNFLWKHFRREWNENRGRLRNRAAFMDGMFNGLAMKLAERQPTVSEEGLVRIGSAALRRKTYMTENFGDTREEQQKDDSNAKAARYAGYVSGRKTEIRSGVKAGEENKTAALPPSGQRQLLLE